MKVFWLCNNDLFPRRFEIFLTKQNISLTVVCTQPAVAIYKYLHSEADLLIMDMNWNSDDSGIRLLNSFLNLKEDVKVILTTVYYQEEINKRYKDLGASGYFF